MSWHSEPGIKPIVRKFLQRNDLFALAFKEGYIFGKVLLEEKMQYRPLKMITSAAANLIVSAATNATAQYFLDQRNSANDVLFVPQNTDGSAMGLPYLLHGGIGIYPPSLKWYIHYPAGAKLMGKFPNIDPANVNATTGDNFSYVDGQLSPAEEPTDWMELWIPGGQHIAVEFFDPDAVYAMQPSVNLVFQQLHFLTLKPTVSWEAKLIQLIASRQLWVPMGQCGPSQNLLSYAYTKDWGVSPMTLDAAANLTIPPAGPTPQTPTMAYRARLNRTVIP